jgi:SecD/SecF fusion protein
LHERRNHLILLGCILAALVGVAFLAAPQSPAYKKPTLGLDLQGGLEVVLNAVPPKGHKLTSEDLDRSIDIMRKRIDKLGVSEPEIRKQGSNQIVIQLAGIHDPAAAAKLIGKTAVLEFYDFEADLTGPSVSGLSQVPVASPSLHALLAAPQTEALADKGTPSQWYLFDAKDVVRAGPTPTRAELLKTDVVQKKLGQHVPKDWQILRVPANTVVVSCQVASGNCLSSQQVASPKAFYLLKHSDNPNNPIPEMKGGQLKLSGTRADIDPQSGAPVVLMQFTGKGKKIFHEITRREAERGALVCQGQRDPAAVQNCAQHFAIVLDREIQSAPYIDFVRNPDGIPGDTGAQIEMGRGGSLSDAKKLALVLQTGALPVSFVTAERTDVSATLGKDSLNEAKKAAVVGLIVVALFLLLFYRFLGLVAVIGLGIYAAFLYAAILIFNVTLTLPGIAGLILTIGVAADANVIVFERIKEEVRAGKSVRAAISAGYAKGFHTIIDANVVTCITALVIFAVATAGVKGFALMLLIGTVISLLTAVAATRALLGMLSRFRWFDDPRFMGATAQEIPRWQRIDVVGRRRLWFILSLVAIGVSVLALIVQGLNLGIDFKGGTQVTFNTRQFVPISKVRSEAGAIGEEGSVVQGRGLARGSDSYKSFQIRMKSLTADEQNKLQGLLTDQLGARSTSIKNVSASFSRQILRGAIVAIIVSFALIALYVTIRYRWRFAVPILRTLVNDVLITLGVYSISGREVTASTVAALLTILGFSIYDTIIVFDRVRENIKLMPRASIARIANVSVWEVLRRSIVTTVITLLPIAALFIFGGATLKDFAFAIMVGISVGAISTIFIATPLLTVLLEREPEFKRRIDRDETGDRADLKALKDAEVAAAAEPEPELVPTPVATPTDGAGAPAASAAAAAAKRERRRQRRRARPHGRAR